MMLDDELKSRNLLEIYMSGDINKGFIFIPVVKCSVSPSISSLGRYFLYLIRIVLVYTTLNTRALDKGHLSCSKILIKILI